MNKRHINRSTEKVLQQKNLNTRISYQRKCHTPNMFNQQKKSKSKPKQKSADKKQHFNSIRSVKYPDPIIHQGPLTQHKKQSPFKHKNRPISNLANARHAKNIQHQLSNLNESIYNDASILDESNRKVRYDSLTLKSINEGKKLMKNNQFDKGITVFSECLAKQSNNIEAKYLLGVCAFHMQLYEDVIKHFSAILSKDDQYRQNVYLFLAIAYKKAFMFEESLATLTRALTFYPKYYDALVLRAKILSKLKRYYDAIEDLNKCLKIQPKNIQAYTSKADCLRALNQHKQAIHIYSQILTLQFDSEVLLKRAIAEIQSDNINAALIDLNRIISKNPLNSEAYLFKGMAYTKIKNYNQAILSYEQAIKFNSSKKATTKALYEVSKLKIEMGDYYGASYTLERASSLEVDMKVIEKLKIFTEGATFIMKKKIKKGVENLTYLSKKEHINQQIRPLLYSFRSYGNFCQQKFINALQDLNSMIKQGYHLDSSSQYNFLLLQGIINCQNNNFKEAILKFHSAETARKQFSDPYIYKSLTKICQFNRNAKTKNKELLNESLKYIVHAIQKQQNNYNCYYISACILYTLGSMEEALQNLEKAIQKSDDHVIKHFYLRGLIKAMLERYKEAYVDFNNVLSLTKDMKEKQEEKSEADETEKEKQILQTYLYRAKCNLLFGEKKKAFQDLQTYISYRPLDSEIHTVAGKLLFSIGACQDAIKAYNYSPNIDKKKEQLLQRAKCYLLLKELNLCLRDMEKIIEMGDNHVKYDYCCLSALKQASKGNTENFKDALKKIAVAETFSLQKGYIFDQSDSIFYKGLFAFYLEDYQEALKQFTKSKNLKAINNSLEPLECQSENQGFNAELFENRIFTDVEIEYNIAICELMLGNTQKSMKVLQKYSSFSLIFQENQESLDEAVDLTPFPITNRLCSIFHEIQYAENIRFKLSFCLPTVTPPEITFEIQTKIIQQLNMNSTQPRPDAPWIKRNTFGVIFTDEMIGTDIDIKTQKSIRRVDQIKIEVEHNSQQKEEISKLKGLFALDTEVENKLAKIMQKNKQRKQ